ncbi:prepilin peptidase [Thermosyntropha lipolytica]|uniref:prepilin peptidase n=1 Tax=Thermosyntropha lipolytica TaxID=54294 RepID=UPI00093551A8|nr:A24 family peptidase [Thermosyntropha lipolytica]
MLYAVFIFLFGLIIGSFLNVVIYRLPRGESVVGPFSFCPLCGRRLRAYDLVPVLSYLWLKGRCRYCQGVISPLYPLVEALTGVLFLLIYIQYGVSFTSLSGMVLVSFLLPASFIDIEHGIIPDKITYTGFMAGIVLSFFTIGFKSAFLGGLVFSLFYLVIALVSRGGMGGGDVKLAALIGSFVGLEGILAVFIISSLAGGIFALMLLLTGRGNRRTEIKFGPFLAFSAYLVWMYGSDIINLYWLMWRGM